MNKQSSIREMWKTGTITRIDNLLGDQQMVFTRWSVTVYRCMYNWDKDSRLVNPAITLSKRFFLEILGRQDICLNAAHRNWIWYQSDEHWLLCCDRRGMALHVPSTTTSDQALKAFEYFKQRVESSAIWKRHGVITDADT